MEHFYQNIQGWFNYEDLYRSLAHKLPNNFKFAEVGVWKGRSLTYFVVESINANKTGTIYAIDHWLGSEEHQKNSWAHEPLLDNEDGLYKHFLSNIEPVKDFVSVIRKSSIEASKEMECESLDAVFVDASHKYQDVLDDLRAWYPKVKPNGLFLGHDFDWTEVKNAVDTFAKEIDVQAQKIDNTCWIIKR